MISGLQIKVPSGEMADAVTDTVDSEMLELCKSGSWFLLIVRYCDGDVEIVIVCWTSITHYPKGTVKVILHRNVVLIVSRLENEKHQDRGSL